MSLLSIIRPLGLMMAVGCVVNTASSLMVSSLWFVVYGF